MVRRRQYQFVEVSDPTKGPSAASKKTAYSHAFRQAHARRRRERVEGYKQEENQISEIRQRVDPTPLVRPIDNNKDPFSSLARPLSTGEYFLLHHYVHVVLPFNIGHCGLFHHSGDHKSQLLREWVGLAVADHALMVAAVFLGTCRYILQAEPGNVFFGHLALQYKHMCLQSLRREMNVPHKPTMMTAAKSLALALDEVAVGEQDVAIKHVQGVTALVSSGSDAVNLTGLLGRMYQKFVATLQLEISDTNHL